MQLCRFLLPWLLLGQIHNWLVLISSFPDTVLGSHTSFYFWTEKIHMLLTFLKWYTTKLKNCTITYIFFYYACSCITYRNFPRCSRIYKHIPCPYIVSKQALTHDKWVLNTVVLLAFPFMARSILAVGAIFTPIGWVKYNELL